MFFSRPAGSKWVDRGLVEVVDFDTEYFIKDNAFHEFDISGIVGKGVKLVAVHIDISASTANLHFRLNTHNQPTTKNYASINTQAASAYNEYILWVQTDKDGKLDYIITPGTWYLSNAVIRGWWII